MFKEVRVINVNSVSAFNKHIQDAKKYSPFGIFFGNPKTFENKKGRSFVWTNDVTVHLSTMIKSQVVEYVFRLDGEMLPPKTAMNIWKDFSKKYKTPKFHKVKEAAPFSASPFMYYNEEYEGQRIEAIGYDLNSAYGNAVINADLPDTTILSTSRKVKEGEMGFTEDGKIVYEGHAFWVFPIMTKEQKQPIIDYFQYWWDRKKNAKDSKEKLDAKSHLNIVVGYWQKYNCFMRAAIVEYVNNYIKGIIAGRNDVLMCNTDSIVCLNKIDELKIGKDLGEWKIEHTGQFAYIGYNYQWNKDKPSYRGIASAWFGREYDILVDGVPEQNNIYYFDKEKCKIRKRS